MRTHAEKGGEIIKETFGHIGDGEYEKWHMRLQGIIMKNGMEKGIRRGWPERIFRYVQGLCR